jgi:hypothetical protein
VLIVLVMATTLGMVWHDHGHCASAQCTLCHLAVDQPKAACGACNLVLARAEAAAQSTRLISRLVARQIPARAPPV